MTVAATAVDPEQPRAWWHAAACRGRAGLFFAEDSMSQRIATAICRRCPVRAECLADVLASEVPGERFGVTAGLTPAQRAGRG